MEDFTARIAGRCARALERFIIRMHGWYVVFGDGTDLEVKGDCFDAARLSREGEKILRLMSLMLGPVTVSHDILPGNVDEGVYYLRESETRRFAKNGMGATERDLGRYGRR